MTSEYAAVRGAWRGLQLEADQPREVCIVCGRASADGYLPWNGAEVFLCDTCTCELVDVYLQLNGLTALPVAEAVGR